MPEVCVSKWRSVIGFQAAGHGSIYWQMGSPTLSSHYSCSCITASAVNCLVSEAMRYTVRAVFGTSSS